MRGAVDMDDEHARAAARQRRRRRRRRLGRDAEATQARERRVRGAPLLHRRLVGFYLFACPCLLVDHRLDDEVETDDSENDDDEDDADVEHHPAEAAGKRKGKR